MRSIFGRSSSGKNRQLLGLRLGSYNFSVASLLPQPDSPLLQRVHNEAVAGLNDFEVKLAALVDKWGLHGEQVRVVLNNDFYRLLQADTPNVPLAERDSALVWALKDVLDFPAAEAIISSFVPPVSVRSGPERLFVAAAQKSKIRPFVEKILASGLKVETIDIPELSCRNLIMRVTPMVASSAVLVQSGRGAVLYVYHDNELVISRPLAGINDLATLFSGYENRQLMDQLVLEIQRTLDFYESQIGRRPIGKLILPPLNEELAPLPEFLKQNLNVGILVMDIPHLLPTDQNLDFSHLHQAWLAIGAALRDVQTVEANRAAS